MGCAKFISYLRVPTDRQGRSGLGLDGQRLAVANYLNGGDWRLIAEFVEVEFGPERRPSRTGGGGLVVQGSSSGTNRRERQPLNPFSCFPVEAAGVRC